MDVVEIDGKSGAELLEHAADLAAAKRRVEVEILCVAVQHAYLHHRDTLDQENAARPGRERARRLGGTGTPEVTEFAASTLGARLGMSTVSASLLMADGLDIVHRLPRLWRRVESGEVQVHYARLVARKTRDLTEQQAAYVDGRVAASADGRITWSRFEAVVDGAVVASDPEAAAGRDCQAAQTEVARPTGSDEHAMRGFYIRAPLPVIAVLDAVLDRWAHSATAPTPTAPVSHASGTTGRCRHRTTASRPSAGGRSSSPSLASTSGATPTARSTWSTTRARESCAASLDHAVEPLAMPDGTASRAFARGCRIRNVVCVEQVKGGPLRAPRARQGVGR
jgi:hypothetical protein